MTLLQQGSRLISKAICASICAILGASCVNHGFTQPAEYGMPSARYKLDGVVRDRQTQNSVDGIRITLSPPYDADTSGATRTDADGAWAIDVTRLPCSACSLRVEDTDGPAHGGDYGTRSIPIAPTRTGPPEHWFQGTFEQHQIAIEISSTDPSPKEQH